METLQAMRTRRSVRKYSAQEVSQDDINAIILAGCTAPVGMGAYDTLRMTVVTNAELLGDIAQATAEMFGQPGMDPFYGSKSVVFVSSTIDSRAPAIEYANAACVIENMMLAAADLGLGSVYLWAAVVAMNRKPGVVERLGLPDGFTPVSAVALGYAADGPATEKELTQRIPVNTVR